MATQKRWTLFTKRTNDPKLAWIEVQLHVLGIPARRHGESWHAPILEVPEEHLDAAWALLDTKIGRRRIDDLPDDHLMFQGAEDHRMFQPAKGGR